MRKISVSADSDVDDDQDRVEHPVASFSGCAAEPSGPRTSVSARYWTIRANSSGSSEAPPTSAPSISGIAMSSAMFPGFTLPPYWMRMASAVSAP